MSTVSNQNINNPIANHPYCYSDRQGCRVVIEVMDNGRSGIGRAGVLAIAVPYDRFSQTLRSIKRSGRKICNVFISQLQLPDQQADVIAETTAITVEALTSATSSEASEVASDAESTDMQAMDCEVGEMQVIGESLAEAADVDGVKNVVIALAEPMAADEVIVKEDSADIPIVATANAELPLNGEVLAEQPVEPVIEPVIEPTIALKSELVANVEIAPTANAKKPKASTKTAASGFNKRKNAQTTTKSPRKPKN